MGSLDMGYFVQVMSSILNKLRLKKRRIVLKQEAMFVEALSELNIGAKNIRIDHPNAKCYADGKEYNIIFPLRYLKTIRALRKNKTYEYCFIGKDTPDRQWVKGFDTSRSYISFTLKGRTIDKYYLDIDYYSTMANSKFTLCPKGDFKWTYRFYEAILCNSIPVVDPEGVDASMDGFKYYRFTDTNHKYTQEICRHNYLLLLKKHTFLPGIIDFTAILDH